MDLAFHPEYPDIAYTDFSSRKLERLIPYQPRPYSTLEIEITTRCNLFCPSCPRTTFEASWLSRDMCLSNFTQIARTFNQFETIIFRGWGEPLLNPHFPEMVRLAYQSGARLVLCTNGVKMLNLGLIPYFDSIIFHLGYGRASTYERYNPGAKFNRVIFNISRVLHWRDSNKGKTPQVVILFAKNKFILRELPGYLETAERLCPDRVVFFDHPFHFRQIDEKGMLPAEVDPGLIKLIDKRLEDKANRTGLELVNQPNLPKKDGNGRCNLLREDAIFVNWSGKAAPCRHCALPVVGDVFTRIEDGNEIHVRSALSGNLTKMPLPRVVNPLLRQRIRRICQNGHHSG